MEPETLIGPQRHDALKLLRAARITLSLQLKLVEATIEAIGTMETLQWAYSAAEVLPREFLQSLRVSLLEVDRLGQQLAELPEAIETL